MEINHPLLSKLRTAANRAASMNVGLAHEIVAATTDLARCTSDEREALRRLSAWPRSPQYDSLTVQARNDLHLVEDEAIRVAEAMDRIAGRPPISEQRVLGDLADAARRAGADVGVAAAQYARTLSRTPDQQLLQQSYEATLQNRVTAERHLAERHLAELEQERATLGKRAGALRSTVMAAERWLAENGLAAEMAA